MTKLILVLSFLLLIRIQGSDAALIKSSNSLAKSVINDALIQATTTINNTLFFLSEIANNATKDLLLLAENIQLQGQQAINSTTMKIQQVVNDSLVRIDNVVAYAQMVGINVNACIVENQQDLQNLPALFIGLELQCVLNEINTSLSIVNSTIDTIQGLVQTLAIDLPTKLQGCITPIAWNTIPCILSVAGEAALANINVPVKIADIVTSSTTFATGIQVRLQACAVLQIFNLAKAAGDIVINVFACTQDKLGGNLPSF